VCGPIPRYNGQPDGRRGSQGMLVVQNKFQPGRIQNGLYDLMREGVTSVRVCSAYISLSGSELLFDQIVRCAPRRRLEALAKAHDASVQMIDTSIVRVHQHGACIIRNRSQSMGRSRGGLTSKIHAVVDTNGLPVRLALTAGEAHDNRLADKLLSRLKSGSMLLADRGYDANWIRAFAARKGALAISRQGAIALSRSVSARIFIALATWSNGSSTRSSTVAGSQRAMTGWRRTTLRLFNSRQSGYGCALMSPRPSTTLAGYESWKF
jgi:transposase